MPIENLKEPMILTLLILNKSFWLYIVSIFTMLRTFVFLLFHLFLFCLYDSFI
jgi:hypothetical protein